MDDDDDFRKADRLAARAARFSNKLPGNRFKELEEARTKERKVFEDQGLIRVGKTELGDAVDMRGTCEKMCSDYEREFREYTREIHPFEAAPNRRMDPAKAVAAYSRSDAGAGHGESAILPSDLRTPQTLVRTLDYLFSDVMSTQSPELVGPPTARKALGYTAGFIRDRTRAIRKEYAMQSSWGHDEAISSFERIARWHILCLRELQEETGMNSDMHIDSAELGRCFTSLRQHYNDRREELGVDLPCPNEPEIQAYMLIFNLADKSVAIPTSELPSVIIDHPLVKLAWEIRRAAQRNFDTQKEGSKANAELGANMINLFVRLLKQPKVPYLLSCLVEVRLREMRRSALRALTKSYPRLRTDPLRYNDQGEIVERRMVLVRTLDSILGCEEQEDEESAYDDVDPVTKSRDEEALNVVEKFDIQVYPNRMDAMGALINAGAAFNDNRDAPYTRRWKLITDKRANISFVDIVNGKAGVHVEGTSAPIVRVPVARKSAATNSMIPPPTKPLARRPSNIANDATVKPATPPPSAFTFSPKPIEFTPQARPQAPPQAASSPGPPSFTFRSILAKPSQPPPAKEPIPPSSFTFTPPVSAPANAGPVPSPLFSQPSFFDKKQEPVVPILAPQAGPSRTSPTVSTAPKSLSPPASPSTPSAKALGKRPATSTLPPTRRHSSVSGMSRRDAVRVAPILKDEMTQQAVEAVLSEITGDLLRSIKQETAARQYLIRSSQRDEAIKSWSEWIYDRMRADVLDKICRKTVLRRLKRLYLSRKYVKLWRLAIRRIRTTRSRIEKDRDRILVNFRRMGLGGSGMLLGEQDGESEISVDRDEFLVDVSLREAATERTHLYAPTTFLHIIARHIAPLLAASDPNLATSPTSPTFATGAMSTNMPNWETVLSTCEDSSSDPSPASLWLRSKFSPKEGDDFYDYGDVLFDSTTVRRYDEIPISRAVGLIVFEVPVKSDDPVGDAADAQDRLAALVDILKQHTNQYDPALLLVSWEDESMEDLVNRLGIADLVQQFSQSGHMSLADTDNIDQILTTTLAESIPVIKRKQQVIIPLRDLVESFIPAWEKYQTLVRTILRQSLSDGPSVPLGLGTYAFRIGIETLNHVSHIIKDAVSPVEISDTSTFTPIELPPFPSPSPPSTLDDPDPYPDSIEPITTYLSNPDFAGLDELSLGLASLQQAVHAGSTLPITPLLAPLAFLVFGELANQVLALDSFWEATMAKDVIQGYERTTSLQFETLVGEKLHELGRRAATASATSAAAPASGPRLNDPPRSPHTSPISQSPEVRTKLFPGTSDWSASTPMSISESTPTPRRHGVKRGRVSSDTFSTGSIGDGSPGGGTSAIANAKQVKAAKNAKLLQAMDQVNRTMGEMNVDPVY